MQNKQQQTKEKLLDFLVKKEKLSSSIFQKAEQSFKDNSNVGVK